MSSRHVFSLLAQIAFALACGNEPRGACDPAPAALDWLGCVPLPPNAVGNDVLIGANAALWVANHQPALTGLRGLFYTIAGGLGLPTGEVLRWQPTAAGRADSAPSLGWKAVPGTRRPNPNGLLLAP
jgi:hypothetical protein